MNHNNLNSVDEYKASMCRNIQAFLTHERLYNFNCLKRLLTPFKVIDFEAPNKAGHIAVKFAQGDKIFIKESEINKYSMGHRNKAIRLIGLSETLTDNKTIITISLKNHNLSNLVKDMPRLLGVIIDYNGNIYKTQDVKYEELALGKVGDKVELVLSDFFSAEAYLNDKVILRNKATHVGNGINFESFGEQEAYVKLVDAADAVVQQKNYVCQEIFGWFQEMGASTELLDSLTKKIEIL